MKKLFFLPLLLGSSFVLLSAENNTSHANTPESNVSQESNLTPQDRAIRVKKEVEEQMKREAKYAQEQRFYQGDEYNLSAVEINKDSLDSIPLIEPDYDFEIDDVYRDDI